MAPPNRMRKQAPKRALDRTDAEIIQALQNNARLTNKELAARVGLAPSTCLTRVRELTRSGALRGFHAEVAPAAMGVGVQALISIRMLRHARKAYAALFSALSSMPEVLSVYHVSGASDLHVHVAVRDVTHLRDIVVERLANRAEIGHFETSVIFDSYRSHRLPSYVDLPD